MTHPRANVAGEQRLALAGPDDVDGARLQGKVEWGSAGGVFCVGVCPVAQQQLHQGLVPACDSLCKGRAACLALGCDRVDVCSFV